MDKHSVGKFFNYNFGKYFNTSTFNTSNLNRLSYEFNSVSTEYSRDALLSNYQKLLPTKFSSLTNLDFSFYLQLPNIFNIINAENDSKQYSNSFKFLLNPKHKKKTTQNLNYLYTNINNENSTSQITDPTNLFSSSVFNTESVLKFKDYKSSNAQFLGSERTVRLLNNLNSNSYKWNLSNKPNLSSYISDSLLKYGNSQNYLYSSSLSNWSDHSKYTRFLSNIV
jgi:hypothetical protein